MKLSIRTSSNKPVLELTVIELIRSFAILLFILWALVSGGEPIKILVRNFLELISLSKIEEPIQQIISLLLYLISFVVIVSFIWKLILFIRDLYLHTKKNSSISIKKLISNKIETEILSSDFSNNAAFEKGLNEGIYDEKELENALGKQIINNRKIVKSNWKYYFSNNKNLMDIRNLPANEKEFLLLREKNRKTLKELCNNLPDNSGHVIKFYVAVVQPSIILSIQKILDECKLTNDIKLITNVCTGPETIRETIIDYNNRPMDDNSIFIFAAPLSAFITTEYANLLENHNNPFCPVCKLIDEKQEILIVENGKKVPLRRSAILYYDNSTAEEYMARIYHLTKDYVEFKPITDYELYKKILNGEALESKYDIQAGDGIIVWPPLRNYYMGRDIIDGYYVSNGLKNIHPKDSKIFLYSECKIFEENTIYSEIALTTIKALIYEFRYLKNNFNKTISKIKLWHCYNKYLSNYKLQFKNLF